MMDGGLKPSFILRKDRNNFGRRENLALPPRKSKIPLKLTERNCSCRGPSATCAFFLSLSRAVTPAVLEIDLTLEVHFEYVWEARTKRSSHSSVGSMAISPNSGSYERYPFIRPKLKKVPILLETSVSPQHLSTSLVQDNFQNEGVILDFDGLTLGRPSH